MILVCIPLPNFGKILTVGCGKTILGEEIVAPCFCQVLSPTKGALTIYNCNFI
jgi:hypothetical protein